MFIEFLEQVKALADSEIVTIKCGENVLQVSLGDLRKTDLDLQRWEDYMYGRD